MICLVTLVIQCISNLLLTEESKLGPVTSKTMVASAHFFGKSYSTTRSLFYKGQRKNVTSPSLSKIRCCHCCIYDVIASLLLNKAPKMETSVSYKGVPYKINCVYFMFRLRTVGATILLLNCIGLDCVLWKCIPTILC